MQLFLALALFIQLQLNMVPVAVNHILKYIYTHRILSGNLRIIALKH